MEGRALHNQGQKNASGALSGHVRRGAETLLSLALPQPFSHRLMPLPVVLQGLAAISFWAPDMNLFRDPRW